MMVASHAARADGTNYCEAAPNTITFDLGHYRGGYRVVGAHGSLVLGDGWQSCPAALKPPAVEKPWDDCTFSLCDLPDGEYGLQFSPVAGAPVLGFKAVHGMLKLAADPRDAQGGHFSGDVTAAKSDVTIDLGGYTGPWRIGGWPGAFEGTETGRRAVTSGQHVTLSLYWDIPYAFSFGESEGATLSVSKDSILTAQGSGHALRITGAGAAALRTAPIRVTPPGGADWAFGASLQHGPQTVILPASSSFFLRDSLGARHRLVLDGDCHPSLEGSGGFTASLAPPAQGCS